MANEKLHEQLRLAADMHQAWSRVDFHTMRADDKLDHRVKEFAYRYVMGYCERYTDRQMAMHFAELVKAAVTDAMWDKIKPEWADD